MKKIFYFFLLYISFYQWAFSAVLPNISYTLSKSINSWSTYGGNYSADMTGTTNDFFRFVLDWQGSPFGTGSNVKLEVFFTGSSDFTYQYSTWNLQSYVWFSPERTDIPLSEFNPPFLNSFRIYNTTNVIDYSDVLSASYLTFKINNTFCWTGVLSFKARFISDQHIWSWWVLRNILLSWNVCSVSSSWTVSSSWILSNFFYSPNTLTWSFVPIGYQNNDGTYYINIDNISYLFFYMFSILIGVYFFFKIIRFIFDLFWLNK